MEELHRVGDEERARSFPALSKCPPTLPKSPSLGSPTQKLFKPNPFGVLRRLHYIGRKPLTKRFNSIIGHWQLIQPPALLPSQEIRGGTESSNSLIKQLAPLAPVPILRCFPSHLINITKTLWYSHLLGNVKGLKSSARKQLKTKHIVLLTQHIISMQWNIIQQ